MPANDTFRTFDSSHKVEAITSQQTEQLIKDTADEHLLENSAPEQLKYAMGLNRQGNRFHKSLRVAKIFKCLHVMCYLISVFL